MVEKVISKTLKAFGAVWPGSGACAEVTERPLCVCVCTPHQITVPPCALWWSQNVLRLLTHQQQGG
eukprot:843051-Pelagomonas_calceolata.AAC.2